MNPNKRVGPEPREPWEYTQFRRALRAAARMGAPGPIRTYFRRKRYWQTRPLAKDETFSTRDTVESRVIGFMFFDPDQWDSLEDHGFGFEDPGFEELEQKFEFISTEMARTVSEARRAWLSGRRHEAEALYMEARILLNEEQSLLGQEIEFVKRSSDSSEDLEARYGEAQDPGVEEERFCPSQDRFDEALREAGGMWLRCVEREADLRRWVNQECGEEVSPAKRWRLQAKALEANRRGRWYSRSEIYSDPRTEAVARLQYAEGRYAAQD